MTRFFLILALAALLAGPLCAQETLRLSPGEAVDMAIKNNLGLEVSRITTETRRRNSIMSFNQFIPGVNASGGLSRDNKQSSAMGITSPQWHMQGGFQVSLGINAAMFENIRRLRLDYEAGLISFEKARAQLERDIRSSYYEMLRIREDLEILQESKTLAERQVEMSRANYRSGLVPELTLLQAQVSLENLKPAIDEAENGLRAMMAQFAMNLGLPYDTRFEFIDAPADIAFADLDLKDLITKAASGKPDIQELRQQILALESTRRVKLLQTYTPNLSLGWTFNKTFLADPWKDSWTTNGNWQEGGSLTLGLSMSLDNLIPFSSNAQGVKDLSDQRRAAAIGLAQAIRGTEVEIYNTVLALEKAQVSLEAQKLTVEPAERTYRLTEEAYRSGLREFLEVQNAELELRRARRGVLAQNFVYLQGLLGLEYAIGVPFGTLSSKGSTNE